MKRTAALSLTLAVAAASVFARGDKEPFQKVVERMDLDRFLGSWYVVALLPTPFEKNAVNGIETYTLDEKGNIRVEYVFREGRPDGKKKVMHQKGWIMDRATNTEWKIQPLWPLRLPYLIIDLAEDYRYTVIGTNNYKYLWIMARGPTIDPEDYAGILSRLKERGYKIEDIKLMEQTW
jgi:apolipoprotein D and lipocalin family protein